ncbi:hypothetical protein Sjap_021345 [Stephania japonica]|uniref:BZIP domain-containing protein n=1 Tax=Stephania japonica TaxID=461633 RepID=A0AAP0HNY2_9MAGN
MANSKATSNFGNFAYNGRQSLRPPRSPLPSFSPYGDHGSNSGIGSKTIPRPIDGYRHHQRTTSEILIEEQPLWLDDLLNEPDTPVRRAGHRRSSSDSFTYLDVANTSCMDQLVHDSKSRNLTSMSSSWGSQGFLQKQDARHTSFSPDSGSFQRPRNNIWEESLDSRAYQSGLSSQMDDTILQSSRSSCAQQDHDRISSTGIENIIQEDDSLEVIGSTDRKESSSARPCASETDPKRAKQQFAQRSRVRKLQYIAELEKNVQSLQAKGSEISAEIDFLEQQNLILSMENKALKQRLDTVAQERLIKYMEHEILEKEIRRLQSLYQQQQQPPPPPPQKPQSHRRSNSKDLDFQFANLSLKHEKSGSGYDWLSAHSTSDPL